ncbi:ribosomal protein S18 acetylase RimI-like enzyme [Microbacterium sp. AK009]|uniref:hypothetical protein n=1 Tax=Microbacterium sp. AK009 TaxID=2723068 RepID=UPI0015CDAD68|nr:hypothetical protein [Microbacterium sp. AK009]NYF15996.1 ribosomal protein S18 acetylase RimI-like enzyme [Microbacterium sp. AK009]
MRSIPLSLSEIHPLKKRKYWHVFEPSSEFVAPWWGPEDSIADDDHWLSGQLAGAEVARCKFVLDISPQSHPVLGEMPRGQLDILALEVAVSARGQGIGRDVLRAIRDLFPLPRLTALNDNAESRGFWDSLGWVRHEHPNPLLRSERVTYSEH